MRLPFLLAVGSALLFEVAAPSAQSQRRPPLDAAGLALQAFQEVLTDGAPFSEVGWRRAGAMVTAPGPWTLQTVTVYEDWFVNGTAPGATADRAEVWTDGRFNGEYDPRTGRYSTDGFTGPMKFRGPTILVRVDGRWKVQGPVPSRPGVSWQAVLRHATELRDTTADPTIKRNAARTVAVLTKYHPR
jgi:hypothetical protein